MVSSDSIEYLGGEGPLEVGYGCFGMAGEKAIVCIWCVGSP